MKDLTIPRALKNCEKIFKIEPATANRDPELDKIAQDTSSPRRKPQAPRRAPNQPSSSAASPKTKKNVARAMRPSTSHPTGAVRGADPPKTLPDTMPAPPPRSTPLRAYGPRMPPRRR